MEELKVNISDELLGELSKIVVELGFDGDSDFVEEAIRDKILDMKKQKFFEISNKVALGLKHREVSPKKVLEDFEKNRG